MSSPFDVAEQQLATTQANPFDIAQKGLNPFDVAEQTTKQSWGIETNPMMFLRSAGEGANVAATGLLNKLWELSQKVGLADPGYVDFNSPLGMVENSRRVGRLAMGRPNVAQMVPSEALVQNVISPPPVAKVGDPVFGSDIGVQPHFRLDDSLVGSLIGAMQTGQTPTTGQLVNEDVDPVNAFAGQNLRGLTTAGMGMMAPAFSQSAMAKVVPAAASWLAEAIPAATKLLFGGQIAAQAPETVAQSAATMGKLSTSEGRQQMANPLAEAAVAVGAPAVEGAILRQLAKAPATKPTVPTMGGVKDVIRPSDRDLMEGRIPPERQLPNFKTPFEQKVEAKLAQVPGPQPSTGGMIVTKEGGQGPVEGVTYRQTGPFTKEQQDALYEKVKKVFSDRDEYKKVIKNAPWLPSSAAGGYNKQLNEVSISSDNFKGKKQLLHTAQHEVLQKVFEQSRQELEQPFAEQFVRLPEKNKQAVEQYLQQAGYSYLDNSFDKVSELAGRFVTDRAKITPLVRESLRQLIGEKMFFLLDKERKTGDLFPKFAKEGETTYLNTGPFTKEQQDAMRQGAEKLLSSSRSISERNLPAANVEALRKGEEELRSGMALTSVRAAITPEVSGFTSPTRKIDAKQLVNRMTNILQQKAPVELQMLKDAGMDELAKRGQMSPEEFAQWAQENGPRVKVETYGMEGKVSEAKKERDKLNGELDTLPREQRNMLDTALDEYLRNPQLGKDYINPAKYGVSKEAWDKKVRILELDKQLENEPPDTSPRATSYYKQVSAFDTDAPMPEWTATKSGKNVQRVDVVIPYSGKVHKSLMGETPDKELRAEGILWRPDNLHENLPNTLGWAMVQYKTGPKGEKIGGMMEAQSRWGQKVAKQARATEENYANEIDWADVAREKARQTYKQVPLLRDYNRLIVKATIEQIKKEGGDHLFIPDAETAMMTEGHDLSGNVRRQGELVGPTYKTREEAESALERYETQKDTNENDKGLLAIVQQDRKYRLYYTRFVGPEQEPGMRLNYDTILPKIAEELTGSKGERVSLGEHKNAFEKLDRQAPNGDVVGYDKGKPRSNLIFRNADGTPKTDISGTMYELPKKTQMTSLTGKDTAKPGGEPQVQYRFSGAGPTPEFVADVKKSLSKWFGRNDVRALKLDTKTPLPDLQEKQLANEVFSNPFAAEKVPVLGRALGGRGRITNDKEKAMATWYAERHGVGPSVASALGAELRGKVNSVFKTNDKGDLNVRATTPGASLKISDVFEGLQKNPNAYALTPEQRMVWNKTMQPVLDRMQQLVKQYDLANVADEHGNMNPYFPRIVEKVPDENVKQTLGGQKVGAKQFFQKARLYDTEAQGWSRGVTYATDVEKRMVTGVERLYRAMADRRLATDPIFGGKTRANLLSELKEGYAEELASGEMSEKRLERMADTLQSRGTVSQPGFFGKIFDAETANVINKELSKEHSRIRADLATANSFLKAFKLGFDFGVGQIQLLPTLYRNPQVWTESQWTALKAFGSREVLPEYARRNKEVIRELSQMGSSFGQLQEMMTGLKSGQAITKIPGLGPVAEAFGRQFQVSLDVAKVELWKAWREVTPKEEWPQVVQTLESQLGMGRMESVMVPYDRALTERVFMLAPSYYRGAINFIGALGERGVSGKIARQAMGAYVVGSLAMFYGVAKALNMSDDEVKERLNPANSTFMMWRVKQGDVTVNVGPGGIFRSFLRLMGNVTRTSIEHPENWKSLASDKNPLTKWYRSHSGPLISMTWDQFSGRDFLGRDVGVEKVASSALPLTVEDVFFRGKDQPPITPVEIGSDILGGQSYPNLSRKEAQRKETERLYPGQDISTNLSAQAKVAKAIKDKRPATTIESIESTREYIAKKDSETRKRLTSLMSPQTQKKLEKLGIVIPGTKEAIRQNNVDIPLSEDATAFMEQRLVAKYQKWFDTYLDTPAITSLSPNARNKYVVDHTKVLRKQAMNETKTAIREGKVTKQ